MFILITIVTLALLALAGHPLVGYNITAHNITSFSVFWPSSLAEYILVGTWILTALIVFVNGIVIPRSSASWIDYLAKFGALDYLSQLNTSLLISALMLAGVGWFLGITALFVPGCILAVGLVSNRIEQWLAL